MVMIPLLLSAGVGAGVWQTYRALRPRPEPIPALLARLDQPSRYAAAFRPAGRPPAGEQLGALALRLLARVGAGSRSGPVFELTEQSPQRHALDQVLFALLGFLTPAIGAVVLGFAGVGLPPMVIIPLTAMSTVAGFVFPELALRDQATRRRRAFRYALSAYLDLVNILLAGGAGIETALFAAADAGDGWAFDRLRKALDLARTTGRSPWDTYADLGASLGVSELSELAASVALAGSHGARIRASLAAKADALRGHQTAETESAAEAATERMTIPLAVLLLGFLVLIAYPALEQVTTATGR
jgi:Flp pilus assembly protein TadB